MGRDGERGEHARARRPETKRFDISPISRITCSSGSKGRGCRRSSAGSGAGPLRGSGRRFELAGAARSRPAGNLPRPAARARASVRERSRRLSP